MIEFPHSPPKGYSYEIQKYKRNVLSIWICNHNKFNYNGGDPVRCIWGFYNIKQKTYYSPVNSSKQGDPVDIDNTTPYTAMQLKLTPLEMAYV